MTCAWCKRPIRAEEPIIREGGGRHGAAYHPTCHGKVLAERERYAALAPVRRQLEMLDWIGTNE